MPVFHHGRTGAVYFGGFPLSEFLREASSTASVDTPETTTFGSSFKSYIVGIPDVRAELSGLYSADGLFGVDDRLDAAFGQALPTLLSISPAGLGLGLPTKIMKVHEVNYQVQGSVTDVVAIQASFQGTELAHNALSLGSYENLTGDLTTASSIDNGAATAAGAYVYATYLSNRSVNCTITIEHSANNSTWTPLATFSALAAGIGVRDATVAPAASTPLRYLRAAATVPAGTGAFAFSAAIARF